MIDLDSQGHAGKCLGLDGSGCTRTLHDVLIRKVPVSEAVVDTGMPGLSLVPSNLSMSTIDLALMPLPGREFRLRNALEQVRGDYDFIVMDAPPSFGLLNLNALMAAADLIVPVLADFLSYDGLKLLFECVQGLEADLSHQLENIFIVVNSYNQTFKIAREALDALRTHYADYLLDTVVRQCTKFAQSSSEGYPIFLFDPSSKGATDLETLQCEVMRRIRAGVVEPTAAAGGAQ
jgi:chromosome partitioning protein